VAMRELTGSPRVLLAAAATLEVRDDRGNAVQAQLIAFAIWAYRRSRCQACTS
jgi:hypothetical protein